MSGGSAAAAYVLSFLCSWHKKIRKCDFGRPTQYEAFSLTLVSLLVSFFFWAVAMLGVRC